MTEWFEEWFNSKEYLEVYQHRNESDAKLLFELIEKHAKIPERGKVLDLACGSGRHSILFARKGFEVTGIDLSENLLRIAETSARKEKLGIEFIKADLRHIEAIEKYDLVVNLFTSFGYFNNDYENFSIFKSASGFLKPGGYFVFDFLNSVFVEKNLVRESKEVKSHENIIQRRRIEGDRVIKDIIIQHNGSTKTFYESVKMYREQELKEAIRENGLAIKETFGDFTGRNFIEETSPRIIIIAQK
ncbi:MAG: class I SAM-dependent methyltransferase [Ignavibacteriaceae bacterium]|nr:class I SAM-dependent methyltransferase [Ignavibacteriaceae bacterium]